MANLSTCECRSRRAVHRTAIAERHRMYDGQFAMAGAFPVGGGQREQDPRHRRSSIGGDGIDARMRMRTAHECAPRHVRQGNVIDITSSSLNKANVLAAAQWLADITAPLR